MSRMEILREFSLFIKQERKWWMAPLLILLVLIGFVIVFAESSVLAPFLYPLF
jgi:hypothetical protein